MNKRDATQSIRNWLQSERLEARDVEDQQAHLHMHVKYPPSKRGHLFNVVIPKNRDLILVYSVTRVDEGQQNKMKEYSEANPNEWKKWLHETRLDLTRADLDWCYTSEKMLMRFRAHFRHLTYPDRLGWMASLKTSLCIQ